MLTSALCTQESLQRPEFQQFLRECNHDTRVHRKFWEYGYIAQALEERGFLKPGQRGIGFAVGTEPLAALFAKYGCDIVGTDLGLEDVSGATAADWSSTNQHAASLEAINYHKVCSDDVIRDCVSFEFVDMNKIPAHLKDFDFCWSAGSVEHVGNMRLSKAAIVNMTNCCRPGGLSVHVTEFNILSDDATTLEGGTVIYRRRDIDECAAMLREAGHKLLPVDGDVGERDGDQFVDVKPYTHRPHLKLIHDGFFMTSIGLIIEAGAVPPGERSTPTGTVWFNDDFFGPAGKERRERMVRETEAREFKSKLSRVVELVTELRELAGERVPTPAYHYAHVADFRRAARAGARSVPLGEGVVLAEVLGDTHLYVSAADPFAPRLLFDGATDLPGSVSLVRRVRPNDTVLDVGAGSGYHAMLLARIVGPKGTVIALEGDTSAAGRIARSVKANGLNRVELHAARVSDGGGADERTVDELLIGRKLDFARVGDPAQLEATWAGLASARLANPELLVLASFHPSQMRDCTAFLAQVVADGYNLSLIGPDGEVAPVPSLMGAFADDSPPWALFFGPATTTPGPAAIE